MADEQTTPDVLEAAMQAESPITDAPESAETAASEVTEAAPAEAGNDRVEPAVEVPETLAEEVSQSETEATAEQVALNETETETAEPTLQGPGTTAAKDTKTETDVVEPAVEGTETTAQETSEHETESEMVKPAVEEGTEPTAEAPTPVEVSLVSAESGPALTSEEGDENPAQPDVSIPVIEEPKITIQKVEPMLPQDVPLTQECATEIPTQTLANPPFGTKVQHCTHGTGVVFLVEGDSVHIGFDSGMYLKHDTSTTSQDLTYFHTSGVESITLSGDQVASLHSAMKASVTPQPQHEDEVTKLQARVLELENTVAMAVAANEDKQIRLEELEHMLSESHQDQDTDLRFDHLSEEVSPARVSDYRQSATMRPHSALISRPKTNQAAAQSKTGKARPSSSRRRMPKGTDIKRPASVQTEGVYGIKGHAMSPSSSPSTSSPHRSPSGHSPSNQKSNDSESQHIWVSINGKATLTRLRVKEYGY